MPNSGRVGKAQEQAIVRHAKANGFPGADLVGALQAALERAREQRRAEQQEHDDDTNGEER